MASAGLREELECSVCLSVYTDPVTLNCGHNFCRVCIAGVLDTQKEAAVYSCPQCREEFQERPALYRNITLRNIAETYLSAQPGPEGRVTFCSHCVDSPVAAVKSCLHCEVSLCEKHLRVHKQSPEHVLTDPTTNPETRKCSVHKRILEYYCTQDATCICVSCCLIGPHKRHKMQSLEEASEEKKRKLRKLLQEMMTKREKTEKRVQRLRGNQTRVPETSAGETERVTALFREIRRQLDDLEKRVLSDISQQTQRLSSHLSDIIQQLEIKMAELSSKMGHTEEMCNTTDPLTVLQDQDTGDLCDTEDGEEDRDRHYLDVFGISHTVHTGMSDIIKWIKRGVYTAEAAEISLDVNTAYNEIIISDDLKSASWGPDQNRPETPERFMNYPQVLSRQSFSSGRHYWEVDVGGYRWLVGMCYPSIERRGDQSLIGSMASAGLREELECSVCLSVYTDPVTLKCGHNFCRVCIVHVLETQEEAAVYSCPQCREEFQERPALHRNITLRNIAENLLSAQPGPEGRVTLCSHCVDFPVAAVKSCLLCEVSLCEKHLRVHKQSPEHVLTDPTTNQETRKCSVHKRILEYYCTQDATCICVSCCLIGSHNGHKMQSLEEASEEKKRKLRKLLQEMMTKREKTEKRVQRLRGNQTRVQETSAGETERVTALFREIRRQLDDLEKRVLSDISQQTQRLSSHLSDIIQQLEIKMAELSSKMGHTEEMCNTTDPLTVLQDQDTGQLCDTEEGEEDRGRDGLDVFGISHTVHTGMSDIIKWIKRGVYTAEAAEISLDVNTANNRIIISDDLKSASRGPDQNRPETPERFMDESQVLTRQSFSSGRHYWEVDVEGNGWAVGMCYPSIERRGDQSRIGWNKKSWCLVRWDDQHYVIYDSEDIRLPSKILSNRFRVYLDYEAGQISFYELSDPIRHLHTFTTTFTEPLHAVLYVTDPMASAGLREELECSICLSVYTDPVTLKCGHNFCRVCIARVLETQEEAAVYSCPQCREKFQERPALNRNITLRNIAENLLSAQPGPEGGVTLCSHCVDSPVAAVKSCLLCEVSLCEKHLRVHKQSPEHVLTDPTTNPETRKCSVHKQILMYYCTQDAACICVSCCLIGPHNGHKMQSLEEASEEKKRKLRKLLQEMMTKREKTEKRVQRLRGHQTRVQETSAGESERVNALFREIRRQLDDLEKRVLSDISQQTQRLSSHLSDIIQQLEIKMAELSSKMGHTEEMCNTTDPLTVLQDQDTGDLCDTEEGEEEEKEEEEEEEEEEEGEDEEAEIEEGDRDRDDLDVFGISHTVHTGMSDIIKWIKRGVYTAEAAEISLDVNTANNRIIISDDLKSASRGPDQNRPETPERFMDESQVLSRQSFSSGRHYWEVDVGRYGWSVGMCYPSIERRGGQSEIGYNKKSWCLVRLGDQYYVRHDSKWIRFPSKILSNRFRVYLDYEAGQISFYELSDPIRHLHTFTTTFTEPLHAGLDVTDPITISTVSQKM
ncbi:uncharacterized protein PAF06_009248 [Gastrophryne carolinensis]